MAIKYGILLFLIVVVFGCIPYNQCVLHSTKPIGKSKMSYYGGVTLNSGVLPSIDNVDTINAVSIFDSEKILNYPLMPGFSFLLDYGLYSKVDIGGQVDLTMLGAGIQFYYKYCISNPSNKYRLNAFNRFSYGYGKPWGPFNYYQRTGASRFMSTEIGMLLGLDLNEKYKVVVTPLLKLQRVYGAGSTEVAFDSTGQICPEVHEKFDDKCVLKKINVVGFPFTFYSVGMSITLIRKKNNYFELNLQKIVNGHDNLLNQLGKNTPLMFTVGYKGDL